MIIGSWAVLIGVVQLYMATKSELLPAKKTPSGKWNYYFGIWHYFVF